MDIILKLVKSVGADTLDQKFGFEDNDQYLLSGFKKQRPCKLVLRVECIVLTSPLEGKVPNAEM